MKSTLSATLASQLLIQCTADVTERREEGEQVQIIQGWMNTDEAIAIVLCWNVLGSYEPTFSPQVMTSMLQNYCREEIADAFVDFFYQIAKKQGVDVVEKDQLESHQFDVHLDIGGMAANGKTLGWKPSWGPFKEPYLTQWNAGFVG